MNVQMYFTAVVLPAEINREVLRLKQLMHERWGCAVGLKSPGHITITPPFWMDTENEASLINGLDDLCSGFNSFPISTNNFSAFKPRTIFLATVPSDELNEIKKATDSFFVTHPGYGVKKESRAFHPHITIATRDLRKQSFFEAWPLFAEKEFRETFVAEGLSVLRHNKKNWDVIHTSPFKKI